MTGNEFLDRLRRYARRHGLPMIFDPGTGKGSHGRVYLGHRHTTVKDRRKEIGPGLLSKMCRDLGITPVRPSAVTAAQVALYTAMRREKVSPKDLAKRLRVPIAEVRRLTDLANYPPLEAIERALAVLGHRLTVALDAAE